jgi:cytochrome P450
MGSAQTSDTLRIPDHVPEALVQRVGLSDGPDFLSGPHAYLASLHDRLPPIFYNVHPLTGSAWIVTSYDDAYFVLRHPELFSTAGTGGPFVRDPDDYFKIIPIEIDPPEHRQYRAILDPIFSPKGVSQLEGKIRTLANQLIDQFIDKGECEFAKEFGRPLPVYVFLDLMGLPQNMMDTFVGWAMGLLHAYDRAGARKCMDEATEYLQKVIAEKTANPDDGVVSTIVHGKPGGRTMSDKEIFGFVFFLFIAGLDTVFATLNNIFVWLAEHPERRREIIDHPENLNVVMEELLRAYTVTFSGRTLTQDHVLGGISMKKGDKITCILPACNYDPAVFENPKEIDFHRPRKPNLAFSGGAHSCMGAHLARLEIKICIAEFLRRIPDFQIKAGEKVAYWPGAVIGPKSVPLSW